MRINILLPHKEKFSSENASSVSITVKNNFDRSIYKKNIRIFGQFVNKPMLKTNFFGIKNTKNIFSSKNKNLASQMCKYISKDSIPNQIIEVHNRPYLIKIIDKKLEKKILTLFLHNDPLEMKGSKTTLDRIKLLNSVDKIYCVSNYIKERFLTGIISEKYKVVVLHNGVKKNDIKVNLSKKKKQIIYVGRLVKEKGVDLFVKAVEKISKNYPNWSFKIIGSARLGDKYFTNNFSENLIERFENIGKQTSYYGYLSTKEVKKIMRLSSIIVVPSIWQEPFGLVVAEAMNNGLAIIASRVGGIPEIMKGSGILIDDINDLKLIKNLENLLSNEKYIEQLQRDSLDHFIFSSSASSKKLDDFRRSLIDKNVF